MKTLTTPKSLINAISKIIARQEKIRETWWDRVPLIILDPCFGGNGQFLNKVKGKVDILIDNPPFSVK